jgi:hypothetical protein
MSLPSATPGQSTYTTSCTNPACYGRAWAGRRLQCPGCGRTLVLYHRATAPVEVVAPGRRPMSRLELEARAIARAHDERIHIFSVPGQPGVYRTSSKSEPGAKHTLVAGGGIIGCSCKGFAYRGSCKHAAALVNRLAREATRGLQAAA